MTTAEELRAVELAENVERLNLSTYEDSRRRLAEIRQIEAGEIAGANNADLGPRKAGRPKKPGSRAAQAKAAGVSEKSVRKLEAHVEIAERFPLTTA